MAGKVLSNDRVNLDFYETPIWQTHVLAKHVDIRGFCIEPCVGNGKILEALPAGDLRSWCTNDIDHRRTADTHGDATTKMPWDYSVMFDWTVSNPPFNGAAEILTHALAHSRVGVALLLRLSFLEPTAKRGKLLAEHPPSLVIVLPRTRYNPDSDSVDTVTTAWMVWYQQQDGPRNTGIIVHPKKGEA
jgi:hypothetical protein